MSSSLRLMWLPLQISALNPIPKTYEHSMNPGTRQPSEPYQPCNSQRLKGARPTGDETPKRPTSVAPDNPHYKNSRALSTPEGNGVWLYGFRL